MDSIAETYRELTGAEAAACCLYSLPQISAGTGLYGVGTQAEPPVTSKEATRFEASSGLQNRMFRASRSGVLPLVRHSDDTISGFVLVKAKF